MFEKVWLKPKVSGTFWGSGSGSWGTWSTLSSLAPRVPTQTRSLYLHSFRQNFALLLLRLAALGARPEALPLAEETLAFDLWCKFERGPAQSSWRMGWIGRGARPRRLPAGDSTRHPLHHGTATASSTGLSTGAGLHPSTSLPSPGHPWLLPRVGRAELCGGGSASDPREDRHGGNTGKAGKEAWQPLPGWWWLLLCSHQTAPLRVTAPRLARTQGTYGRGGLQLWAGWAGLVSHRGRLKNKTKQKPDKSPLLLLPSCVEKKRPDWSGGLCRERQSCPTLSSGCGREVHGHAPWVRVTPLPCRAAQGPATAKPGAAAPKAPSVMGGSGAEARRCPWRSSGLSASSWAGWSWSRA